MTTLIIGPNLRDIRMFVDSHLTEKLTVPTVAAGCCMSEADLRRLLGPMAGRNLRRFVARRRILRLARLVLDGEKVEYAILSAGLRNWNNVIDQCKRNFGCAPHELRFLDRSAVEARLRRLGLPEAGGFNGGAPLPLSASTKQ